LRKGGGRDGRVAGKLLEVKRGKGPDQREAIVGRTT